MSDFMCGLFLLPETQRAVIKHMAGRVSLEKDQAAAAARPEQLVNISK